MRRSNLGISMVDPIGKNLFPGAGKAVDIPDNKIIKASNTPISKDIVVRDAVESIPGPSYNTGDEHTQLNTTSNQTPPSALITYGIPIGLAAVFGIAALLILRK